MNTKKLKAHLLLWPEKFWNDMKTSTWQLRAPDEIGCFQQIVAHVGGMVRARLRHRPIHFTFHWRGICRALLVTVPPHSQLVDLRPAANGSHRDMSSLSPYAEPIAV